MTFTASEIMDLGGQLLPFSRDLREALGVYARRRWPLHTSVHASRAWRIPKTTAANLLKGHASDATVTAVLRAGGWGLAIPVIGAVIGQPVHEFFREQIKSAAREQERAQEHERLASAAYGRLVAGLDHAGPDRDRPAPVREAGRSFGALGADTPRGLETEASDNLTNRGARP